MADCYQVNAPGRPIRGNLKLSPRRRWRRSWRRRRRRSLSNEFVAKFCQEFIPLSPYSPFSFHYNLKSMRILLLLLQRLIAFLCISNLIKRRFSGQEVSFVSCTYITDIEKSFPYTIPYHTMYLSCIDTRIAECVLKQSQTIVTYGHVSPPIYSMQFDDPMPLF